MVHAMPATQEQTLGQFIRTRRLAMGLTQEQLAERIGLTTRQAEISHLERDRVEFPRRDRMEKIANALNVTLGDLLIATGWLEIEHAAMIEQIEDDSREDPDVLDDAIAVLSAAKELVTTAARLLDRAESHVSSITAVKAKRDRDRANAGASNDG